MSSGSSGFRCRVSALLVATTALLAACTVDTPEIDLSVYERPFEARLSGGFRYRQCDDPLHPVPTGNWASCSPPPPAIAEPGGDSSGTRGRNRDDQVDLSHRASLFGLARGGGSLELEKAASLLRRLELVATTAARARILNDLCAVYFSQAAVDRDPSLLLDALEAASKALQLEPHLQEGLFNRALVLSALSMNYRAQKAWRSYLDIDSSSPWSREAAVRLARFRHLRAPADPGDMLMTFLDRRLGPWAEAITSGDLPTASRLEDELAHMAGELVLQTRDETLAELAEEMSRGNRQELAKALTAYVRGREEFKSERYEAAAHALLQARKALPRGDSGLRFLTDIWLAGTLIYRGRFGEAFHTLSAIEADLDPVGHPYLMARVHWTRGFAYARLGRHGSALAEYSAAEATFRSSDFHRETAATRMLRTDALLYVGLLRESWADLLPALRHFASRHSWERHNLLLSAADTARDLRLPLASRQLSAESVATALKDGSAADRAEAFLRRAENLISFADDNAAWRDLVSAADKLEEIPKGRVRDRLTADVVLNAHRLRPDARIVDGLALNDAIEVYRRDGPRDRFVEALVAQARTLRHAGRLDEAEDRLDRVVELLAGMNADLDSRRALLTHWESTQEVFDELLDLRLDQDDPPENLLALAEAARTPFETRNGAAVWDFRQKAWRPEIEFHGRRVFAYLVTDSRIVAWSFGADGTEGRVLAISPRELALRVEGFAERLRNGVLDAAEAESLYRILIGWSPLAAAPETIVIPDRFLYQLPFAALMEDAAGGFLIETSSLQIAPSLRALSEFAPEGASQDARTPLLVGDPSFNRRLFPRLERLKGAEAEVRRLGALLGGAEVLVGTGATKKAVLAALPEASILHVASHAVTSRWSSGSVPLLVLADGGVGTWESSVLAASDLEGLDLSRIRLVFLAGCGTSPGSRSRLQGLYGLAEPFLSRGAEAVVATLWDIEDRASAALVERFYETWVVSGNAAEALRHAQLAILRGGDPDGPRNWAAFQLIAGGLEKNHPASGKSRGRAVSSGE